MFSSARNLLPPGIPKPKPIQSTCHTNCKRYRQGVRLWRLANDFLLALTALDSGLAVTKTIQRRERPSHGPSLLNITAAQQRLHCLCLREAARLEKERRTDLTLGNGELTGAQYTSTLLKVHADSRYGAPKSPDAPQIPLQSVLLDEPAVDSRVVHMLDSLSSA